MNKTIVLVFLVLVILIYIFVDFSPKKEPYMIESSVPTDLLIQDTIEESERGDSVREFEVFNFLIQEELDFILALPGVIQVDNVIMSSSVDLEAHMGIRVVKEPAFRWEGLEPKISNYIDSRDGR